MEDMGRFSYKDDNQILGKFTFLDSVDTFPLGVSIEETLRWNGLEYSMKPIRRRTGFRVSREYSIKMPVLDLSPQRVKECLWRTNFLELYSLEELAFQSIETHNELFGERPGWTQSPRLDELEGKQYSAFFIQSPIEKSRNGDLFDLAEFTIEDYIPVKLG